MGLSSVPRPFLYIVMFIQLDCETVSGIEMENNAAINPVAGTFGVIYWTQMKKPITSDRLKLKNGSGEWNRTIGLQVMSLNNPATDPSKRAQTASLVIYCKYRGFAITFQGYFAQILHKNYFLQEVALL